ncbi:SusF/SusE family outer membrane protein [Flavobacterium magnum]|nr:SusF/SusE family outer membrane protein [Flavobacterium magnum]
MKKLLSLFLLISAVAAAQIPQGLNYQAVVRDGNGIVLANHEVTFWMGIVKNTADNSETEYLETHTVTTDDIGQVSFVIGQGNFEAGTPFSQLDWAHGNTYLRIGINTGSGYVNLGTTQFMSVPYALFAGNAMPNGNNPGDMLFWNGTQWQTVPAGYNGQTLTFCNGVPTWGPCPDYFSRLAVPGNHQGWLPATADQVALDGPTATYEGYMSLDGEYKFVAPNATGSFEWNNPIYGDDGSFSGTLMPFPGETNCTAPDGYYLVKANIQSLTYSTTPITTWGVIGSATPGGWDYSTPLTYNTQTKKWTGVVTMNSGEFKFRANNEWTLNLGLNPNSDNFMDYDGANLSVDAAASYYIELDLSNPRQYTYTAVMQ